MHARGVEGRSEETGSLAEQVQGEPMLHSTLRTQNFWTRDMPFGRYVLVTAGPVFTEEMWRLACCALQDAFSATLKPVKVRWGGRKRRALFRPLTLDQTGYLSSACLLIQLHSSRTWGENQKQKHWVGSFLFLSFISIRFKTGPGARNTDKPYECLLFLLRTCLAASTVAQRASVGKAARCG